MEQGTARWQPLPDSLGPDALLLVKRLRGLKQQTGLSLAALARRTAHSKSAWHRYLNGVKLPPRTAVEALGRLAGADVAPLLALWEDACRGETGSALSAAPQPPEPEPPRAGAPVRQLRRAAGVLTVLATLSAAACAVGFPALSGGEPERKAASCHGESCQGQYSNATRCSQDATTVSTATDDAYAVRRVEVTPITLLVVWCGGEGSCNGGYPQRAWANAAPVKAAPSPATTLPTTLAAAKKRAPSSARRSVSYENVE